MSEDRETSKADLAVLKSVVERLDLAIEKLIEFTTGINKMLVLYEGRITVQEETVRHISFLIEDRKQSHIVSLADTKTKINELQIDTSVRINDLRIDLSQHKKELELLNRWKYLVLGASTVVGFILARSDIVNKFFS